MFSQSHQTNFCTDCLDVGIREVIFSHDQVVQGQDHPACVDLKEALLSLFIRRNGSSVNVACSDKCWIQSFCSICGRENFHITP